MAERGRLEIGSDPNRWIRTALSKSRTIEAPMTLEVAIVSRSIDLTQNDPADRFIAASAKVLDLALVTADRRLLNCPEIQLIHA